MLSIEKIDKFYGHNSLFKGADLIIHRNEKVGVIGPNGSGKTTLFRLIEGVEEVDDGRVAVNGKMRIGVLKQELEESHRPLLLETIEGDPELARLRKEREELQQSLENSAAPPSSEMTQRMGAIDHRLAEIDAFSAESRAGAILLGLGFAKGDLGRPLADFSGGWRMRVALARLLFSRADILLLDEPTNHLDLESVAWLEQHLARMSGTVLIISHDKGFLNRVTNVTVALEAQKLTRYAGSFDSYEKQREERRRLLIKSADKQDEEIERLEAFINRFRAQANKAKQVQSRIKQLDKMVRVERPPPAAHAPIIRLPKPPPCARDTLTLRDVGKRFGDNVLFENLQLTLEKGNKVGLLGPNGVGKSSLLKIIVGTLPMDAGEAILGDRVKTAHFAQHTLESLNPTQSIIDSAAQVAPAGYKEVDLRTVLGGFLFTGEAVFKEVAVLSGGERARLALARLFLSGANVLLLDEPTNHLDMGARLALKQALESYAGTLIVISHDRDLLEGVCDRFWVVGNGTVRVWESSLGAYLEQTDNFSAASGGGKKTEIKPEDTPGKKLGNRELRKEAAAIRQKLGQTTKKAKVRISTLEKTIHDLEVQQEEAEQRLADPELHHNPDNSELKELLEKSGRLNSQLAAAMEEWEKLSLEIEGHEAEAEELLAALKE